jgi:hypothetical protein
MALDGTYSGLIATAASWLNRDDLTAQYPDFIVLAESEMKRRLRRATVRADFTVDALAKTTPADLAELRSMYPRSGTPSEDKPIRICTPEMLAEIRARNSAALGRPAGVAVMAGQFVFAPAPDQNYTFEIFYYSKLVPLTAQAPSSTLFTEAPDLYLYGLLLQAAPYLENDERIPVWEKKFDAAIEQLNLVRENEEYAASIRDVRLPRVFG